MRKFISVTVLAVALCMLGGCGSSKDKAAEATTEGAATEVVPVEMNAADYVELGEYKGLTIEGASTKVTDEEVEEEVQYLAEDYTEYKEVKNRDKVKDGDYVNIDYTCTIDGELADEYSDTEIDTQIGSGEYSLGEGFDFEERLIGAKVGETVKMDLTFPEDYDDTEVAGKACTMEVTVNAIEKEVVPELTDAFIKENTDCNTLDEYREQVRQELEDTYRSEAEQTNQDTLWEAIMNNCTQKKEFSEDMVAQEMSNVTLENEEWAGYFDMDVEEFIQEYYAMTVEEYAKDSLKRQCVQDLLVEAEGIEISDEEFDAEIQTYIDEYGYEDKDEILQYYTEDEIRSDMMYTKLMTKLLAETTVTETAETATAE